MPNFLLITEFSVFAESIIAIVLVLLVFEFPRKRLEYRSIWVAQRKESKVKKIFSRDRSGKTRKNFKVVKLQIQGNENSHEAT